MSDTALGPGYWLLQPEIWIIASILLIILEVTLDGSMIIFLPLGLAATINGLIIYVQEAEIMGANGAVIDSWQASFISFAIFSIIFSIILRFVARHRRTDSTPDVNDY